MQYVAMNLLQETTMQSIVVMIARKSIQESMKEISVTKRRKPQSSQENITLTVLCITCISKYNEENGTRLSYGQYRAKIESGEIAI